MPTSDPREIPGLLMCITVGPGKCGVTMSALHQAEADFAFIYAEKLLAFVKGWQSKGHFSRIS